MDDRFRKISCYASSEISPPILLRRRLSVPETIMRKHMLAQKRSLSQESNRSQNSEGTQSCTWPDGSGSDPNLARKKDNDIRRSTLIKRFWENTKLEKALQFPRTFSEWQYSFGKLKLSSNTSTPEHLRTSRKSIYDETSFKTSPKHRLSKHEIISPKRKTSIFNENYGDLSRKSSVDESPKHTTKMTPRNDNDDSYLIYSSNFSTVASSDSRETTTRTAENSSETNHMDAPTSETFTHDSAYTNSYSSFVQTSTPRKYDSANQNNSHNIDNQTIKAYQISSNGIEQADNTPMPDLPIKYQFVLKENPENDTNKSYEFIPKLDKNKNESSTQTNESTNLNVITNVQLSQSTLNLIFAQVMQDVNIQSKSVMSPEMVQPSIINVQNIPSFTFKKEQNNIEVKKESKISEVNTGSPYKISDTDVNTVPRLSALPRTTSMEVNISSNESMDKESDTSLADSLDDSTLFKDTKGNFDDKMVRGELSLLPDNSKSKIMTKKSSVFYIPIESDKNEIQTETKEEIIKDDVSSHFPAKLKEKLLHRQLIREEKQKENKLKSFAPLDCENGNYQYFDRTPEKCVNKSKPRKKMTLPIIETSKKHQESEKGTLKSTYTQRSLSKYRESVETTNTSKNKSFWLPKTKNKLSPISKSDEASNPRRFYHKTEKQIEILEIMEIVEPERGMHLTPKVKSKIPVLVHQKLPKIQPQKPSYLDFDITQNDPKLDQLIANILIDTLNLESDQIFQESDIRNANSNFDIIPEEQSRCNSTDLNMQNNNPNLIEKAAEILTKQVLENNNLESDHKITESLDPKKDHAKMPKGWITFYMLQKNSSPDSTSDEGKKIKASKIPKTTAHRNKECRNKYFSKYKYKDIYKDSDYKTEEYFETETESENMYKNKFKKSRNHSEKKTTGGGWSVTISGTTTNDGKNAPDLEMRLKFPQINKTTNKNEEEDDTDRQFPPLSTKGTKTANTETGFTFEEACLNRRATELSKTKHCFKNTDYISSVIPSRLEPRPTKTSTQRCKLNRTGRDLYSDEVSSYYKSDKNYENLFNIKLPDILTVNGNTFNRGKNAKLDKLNERDLKTFLAQIQNQHSP